MLRNGVLMDAMPTPQYALTDDGVHIAYTVVGDGPMDLVLTPGFVGTSSGGSTLWSSIGRSGWRRSPA